MRAGARARSNMALVKYWGKRDEALVLPHTGSLSMTLDALFTETFVEFGDRPGPDRLLLDGAPASEGERQRASALIELVRTRAPGLGAATIESRNSFPTASGLASSASGFAALAAAAAWAAGLDLPESELSILARRASGSACRSLSGGFVEWRRGERADGSDSYGVQRLEPGAWDVAMAIALVDTGRKEKSSRDAMRDTVETSPYFDAWVRSTSQDLDEARSALAERRLEVLGEIAERSFLAMHAAAMAARPPSIFWLPPTLAILSEVRRLRASGVGAWATIDAGPHVAVFCARPDAARIASSLESLPGLKGVIVARPGPGVERL